MAYNITINLVSDSGKTREAQELFADVVGRLKGIADATVSASGSVTENNQTTLLSDRDVAPQRGGQQAQPAGAGTQG